MRRASWHLGAAVALLVLLAAVATLQYRWVGDVSRAERERLQAGLRSRAADFSASLDADLTRAFAAFEVDAAEFKTDPYAAVRGAADRAARDTSTGAAVRAIYVAQPGSAGRVRRMDDVTRALVDGELPAELASIGRRLPSWPSLAIAGLPLPPGFLGDAVDGDAPALIIPIPSQELPLQQSADEVFVRTVPAARTPWQALVVWLDRDRLATRLVAPLVARHFGDPDASDFNVSVLSRDGHPVYRTGAADVNPATADLAADVFALRLADLHWTRSITAARGSAAPPPKLWQDRVAITIVRRGAGASDNPTLKAGDTTAGWKLLVQSRLGSLDAVVARSRLRNLFVSIGVLGVLAAGFGLILVASAREQRTARQQLEFVASVSHELRTPLAVIRSAGENLADGVVSGDQVLQYGSLISREGRRLSEMVERVMDFAGITSGTSIRSRRPADVRDVLSATVAAIQPEAADRNVAIRTHTAAELPLISVDADALRSALQNVVGNAVKYSQPGGGVDVDVASTASTLRLTVSDRGIGIDAADLPHVFEPFFRGRRAVDAQIRGSGVGLSVVRQIIEAHGGVVRIEAREGGGVVLTIELPVASGLSVESAA